LFSKSNERGIKAAGGIVENETLKRKSLSFFSKRLKKGTAGTGASDNVQRSNGIVIF
jgi:hypothetical protein